MLDEYLRLAGLHVGGGHCTDPKRRRLRLSKLLLPSECGGFARKFACPHRPPWLTRLSYHAEGASASDFFYSIIYGVDIFLHKEDLLLK